MELRGQTRPDRQSTSTLLQNKLTYALNAVRPAAKAKDVHLLEEVLESRGALELAMLCVNRRAAAAVACDCRAIAAVGAGACGFLAPLQAAR
jgi:hypothetical protein